MSAVVIAGNTSGTVTLQAPAVAGTTVLNLPTVSGGTLVTTDSSGNVALGNSTPINGDRLNIIGTSGSGAAIAQCRFDNTPTAVAFRQYKSRSATIGGNTTVQNGDYLGLYSVYAADGTGYILGGYAGWIVDGAVSTNIVPTKFSIATGNTSGSTVEQVIVKSDGSFQMNSGYGSAATAYGCRAWVNFNGTTSPGTIRASGNVTSVTKNATGDYTVNFTNAMPDANYSICYGTGGNSAGQYPIVGSKDAALGGTAQTTTAFRMFSVNLGASAVDTAFLYAAVFR